MSAIFDDDYLCRIIEMDSESLEKRMKKYPEKDYTVIINHKECTYMKEIGDDRGGTYAVMQRKDDGRYLVLALDQEPDNAKPKVFLDIREAYKYALSKAKWVEDADCGVEDEEEWVCMSDLMSDMGINGPLPPRKVY